MQTNIGIIAFILVVIFWYMHRREHFDVPSEIDKRVYPVLGGFNDMSAAANRLAQINAKNSKLINYMVDKFQPNTHGYLLATRLKNRYRPDRLVENDPVDKYNTSYTEDKGEKVAMCLREKITGSNNLHDHSILEFVNLHELAHICSEGYGHDEEFWTNFKFLLREANLANIHHPVDYSKKPVNYCGLDVMYNPYFDIATA